MYRVKVRYRFREEEMLESKYFWPVQVYLNKALVYLRSHDDAISVALYEGRRLLFKESKPKSIKKGG